MAKHTISYKETGNAQGGGFSSFHSFNPEFMGSLDNEFFSIKNGQLHIHYDETNPVKVNYYGEQFYSKIITIFNREPSIDKIFKTINIEGSKAWDVFVKTNYTESNIESGEFNRKESRFFAYIRKNTDLEENNGSLHQGIGIILSSQAGVLEFSSLPAATSIGDGLYQSSEDSYLGVITDIDRLNNTIAIGTLENTPEVGLFSYSSKDPRIEGAEIRGYYMEVELVFNETGAIELFAINSNAVKSYV